MFRNVLQSCVKYSHMSKSACVFFLLGFLALAGCNDQGEPEPEAESFLTVTLGAGYSASGDMWAFATDDTGKLLDAGPLQTGSSLYPEGCFPTGDVQSHHL